MDEVLEVNDSAPEAKASACDAIEALPEGVFDFDASVKDDPHQGTTYVVDTFNYYRNREVRSPLFRTSECDNDYECLNYSLFRSNSGYRITCPRCNET